jgi:GDPmannose 4,6-dehydratase
MMSEDALIFGVSGQDGSYLAELLLKKGYRVYGVVRRNSVPEHQTHRIDSLDVETIYGDLLDPNRIHKILFEIGPCEIYNLASQSHVRISFDIPQFTAQVNGLGVLNLLEAYRQVIPSARFYQASSSEMFGNNVEVDGTQNENTKMDPTSPYGCAKLFAYNLVRHYRRAYGLFACNGICFNHTSVRRGSNFVVAKVIRGALECKYGNRKKLELGNLETKRDWGFAGDYVEAMWMMLQHDKPDDFVVATGYTYSIKTLCEIVFGHFGMDWEQYVEQNPYYMRPEELMRLRGDASKIRKVLGWKAKKSFRELVAEMCTFWDDWYCGVGHAYKGVKSRNY